MRIRHSLTEKELIQAYFEAQRQFDFEEANNYVYDEVQNGGQDLDQTQIKAMALLARSYINASDAYLNAIESCFAEAYKQICKEVNADDDQRKDD